MWSLGIGVWWSTSTSIISSLLSKLKARSTYFENKACTKNTLGDLNSEGLLEKASIITTPTAYSNGFIHSVKPEQTLGSELIINGDFATDSNWNKGAGWSISNNTAISDGSNTSGSIIAQAIQIVEGKTYQVIVDVDSVDSGRVRFYSNYLGSGGQADITSSGTFTYNVKAIDTGGRNVGVQARDAGTQAVINSISVKEVTTADFTFTRNSPATRVNPQGLVQSVQILGSNVVTNGDFATNADWTAGDGWSFGGNKASCDGTQTNVTNLIQTISTNIQNQLVKISFTLDISGDLRVNKDVSFNNNATFGGDVSFNSDVSFNGDVTIIGNLKADKITNEYIINTDGTNLEAIFQNPFINPYLSQSDSILEIYDLLGVEAARNKIIIELMNCIYKIHFLNLS